MTAHASNQQTELRMTIDEMCAFMVDLDNALARSSSGALAKEYPGTAHVAMPHSDLQRIGVIRRFFETIRPHADDIRRTVAVAQKRVAS